jgi:hypothetical protein
MSDFRWTVSSPPATLTRPGRRENVASMWNPCSEQWPSHDWHKLGNIVVGTVYPKTDLLDCCVLETYWIAIQFIMI